MKKVDLIIKVRKHCNLCDRYNYSEAKYCNYCGELISNQTLYFICWLEDINKSPDLLHRKDKDSNHPNSDRTRKGQKKQS